MGWTLLVVVLSQAGDPAAAVLLSRRAGVDQARAEAVTREVERTLAEQGVRLALPPGGWARRAACVGEQDPVACDGDVACLAQRGGRFEVPLVVGVEVGGLDDDLVIRLAAVDTARVIVVAESTVAVPASQPLASALGQALPAFSEQVKKALPPPPPRPQLSAAVEARLAPSVAPSARSLAWIPAVAGGALAAGGLYLLGQAAAHSSTLSTPEAARGIELAQAAQLRAEGERAQTVGVVLVGAAGAALITSGAMLLFGGSKDLRVGAVIGPRGGALSASMRF